MLSSTLRLQVLASFQMKLPYKASFLLALLSAAALAPHVAAHGSLFVPRPRNWLTNSQWTGVAPWYTYSRDTAGQPIIVDPGQNGVENFGNGHGGGQQSGNKPLAGPGAHLFADTPLAVQMHCINVIYTNLTSMCLRLQAVSKHHSKLSAPQQHLCRPLTLTGILTMLPSFIPMSPIGAVPCVRLPCMPHVCSCSAPATYASTGVCGDPFQHYSASNFASLASLPIQATYTQGQEITVEWIMAANHGGRIGLKVCPSGRTGLTQACFDIPGNQLQR